MTRIFITGATGFIGGRLAEVASAHQIPVVGLVRTWSHAARLSRLPVHMSRGDVLDIASLRSAMAGCDVVFHCAVDNRLGGEAHRRVSAEGTANVMQASLEGGVKRVVHVSSTAVYGYRPSPGAAVEEERYEYSGDTYCDGKIDGEKVALRYWHEHGLPVTVLRPTIVYGPFGDYTRETIALIRSGRMVLVNGGSGICNSLYVDNLIQAMFQAAELNDAVGEIFHVSDSSPVTWQEFIESHARAIGGAGIPFPSMTEAEIAAARSALEWKRPSSLKQAIRVLRDPRTRSALHSIPVVHGTVRAGKAVGRLVVPAAIRRRWREALTMDAGGAVPEGERLKASPSPLSHAEVLMVSAFDRVVFSIEKARRVLGYDPAISFEEGMERTTQWIKWARL